MRVLAIILVIFFAVGVTAPSFADKNASSGMGTFKGKGAAVVRVSPKGKR